MFDENKHNILYFEAPSMRELYQTMERWQNENEKRFLSMSIENHLGKFCCIALTNPTEVIILSGGSREGARVSGRALHVKIITEKDESQRIQWVELDQQPEEDQPQRPPRGRYTPPRRR